RAQLRVAGALAAATAPLRRRDGRAAEVLERGVALADRAGVSPTALRAAYGQVDDPARRVPLRALVVLLTSADGRLRAEPADPAGALRHFAREYGPAATAPSAEPAALHAAIAWGADGTDDGHKTVGWRVRLGSSDGEPLALELGLRGRPRRFALSLVQGFLL